MLWVHVTSAEDERKVIDLLVAGGGQDVSAHEMPSGVR